MEVTTVRFTVCVYLLFQARALSASNSLDAFPLFPSAPESSHVDQRSSSVDNSLRSVGNFGASPPIPPRTTRPGTFCSTPPNDNCFHGMTGSRGDPCPGSCMPPCYECVMSQEMSAQNTQLGSPGSEATKESRM